MEKLEKTADLVVEYIGYMFGCGVHSARVVRCAERICQSQGISIEVLSTLQHFTVTISDDAGHCITRVASVVCRPISFEHNTNLSALSWRALDQRLTLDQICQEFKSITSRPRIDPILLTAMVGIANACFCKLFGGDLTAAAIVCVATMIGFTIRQYLTGRKVNLYIIFAISAFAASICASTALLFDCTADIAIATIPYFIFKRRALSMTRGR